MASQTVRVVGLGDLYRVFMRVVARGAADTRVFGVVAAAVREPIGLETNVGDSLQVH